MFAPMELSLQQPACQHYISLHNAFAVPPPLQDLIDVGLVDYTFLFSKPQPGFDLVMLPVLKDCLKKAEGRHKFVGACVRVGVGVGVTVLASRSGRSSALGEEACT